MKYPLTVKYKIGSVLKTSTRHYSLIGYEYIEGRAIRYIYLYLDNGKTDWMYLYEFEIQMLVTS